MPFWRPIFSLLSVVLLTLLFACSGQGNGTIETDVRTPDSKFKVGKTKNEEKEKKKERKRRAEEEEKKKVEDPRFVRFEVNPKDDEVAFFEFEKEEVAEGTIEAVKDLFSAQRKELLFAMNGGMYHPDFTHVGLYVEEGRVLSPLNTDDGSGNFFLKPNGVFFLTSDNKAGIRTTEVYDNQVPEKVEYATQSGPMLLVDGVIHPMFQKGSPNLRIRNGVGILPDNQPVFAISIQKVNFYDFASYMKELGCQNALVLDGDASVSTMYRPDRFIGPVGKKFKTAITVSRPLEYAGK